MSGGGGSTNTVQKSDPWGPQQPFLEYGYGQARNNYQNLAPQYYPNATYTPFSQQTEQAMGMAQNRAMQGSPVESAMQNYVTSTMQGNPMQGSNAYLGSFMGPGAGQGQLDKTAAGDYLNSNPYLDQMYNSAASRVSETFNDQIMPGINASFGHAGGTGSKIHQELATDAAGELSQTLGQMASNIYGNNYQQERARQLQAAGMQGQQGLMAAGQRGQNEAILGANQRGAAALAPTAAGLDWQNIDRLGQVGSMVEGKAGQVLADDMARWDHYQNLPWNQLGRYTANIQGNVGASTTSQSSADPNPMANAAGAALLPYAASSAINAMGGTAPAWLSNPYTAAAAAALAYFGSR